MIGHLKRDFQIISLWRFKAVQVTSKKLLGADFHRLKDIKQFDDIEAENLCREMAGFPMVPEAIQKQAAELDFAPPFQMGHPKVFELAERLIELTPPGLDKVFFTNSGSESVETGLKIALAYQRVRGEGARTRLIGREQIGRAHV